jgi:tetratricopeptide (TPR) repeat protein
MRSLNVAIGVVALIVSLASARATAGSQPPIVVEAYDAAPPADAASLTSPLFAELASRGYLGGEQLAALVGERISAPAGSLSASQLVQAQKQVEAGFQSFIDGDYDRALANEQKALATYQSAPGSLAGQEALRDLEYKALLIGARSADALGRHEDAFSVMSEAVRAFPDRTPSAAQFDPSVSAL